MKRGIENIKQIHNILAVEINATRAKNRLNKKAIKGEWKRIAKHIKGCTRCSKVITDFLRDISKITNQA